MSTFIQIVAWSAFVFWQPSGYNGAGSRRWYEKESSGIVGAPPGWLFGIVWSLLYALIVATAVLYFDNSTAFVTSYVLFLVNLVFNKMWVPIFFGLQWTGVALFVILLMIGTGVTVLVLMGLNDNWLAFGLYLPYILWCCYALILNVQFYVKNSQRRRIKT